MGIVPLQKGSLYVPGILRLAPLQNLGQEIPINPEDPDVQEVVNFIYNYIVEHKIIDISGNFQTLLNAPININGTYQVSILCYCA